MILPKLTVSIDDIDTKTIGQYRYRDYLKILSFSRYLDKDDKLKQGTNCYDADCNEVNSEISKTTSKSHVTSSGYVVATEINTPNNVKNVQITCGSQLKHSRNPI